MRVSGNKVVFALAATLLAAALIVFAWNVIGLSVQVGLRQQIEDARQKWEQKSGGNYRAIVRVIDYNHPQIGDVTVLVKDDKLVRVSNNSPSGAPIPPELAAGDTIEALFVYAQAQVASIPYWYISTGSDYHYRLRINPDLGYIEEFKVDFCGRSPLAAHMESCQYGFDVLQVDLGG